MVTLSATALGTYLLVVWDDARTREDWVRAVEAPPAAPATQLADMQPEPGEVATPAPDPSSAAVPDLQPPPAPVAALPPADDAETGVGTAPLPEVAEAEPVPPPIEPALTAPPPEQAPAEPVLADPDMVAELPDEPDQPPASPPEPARLVEEPAPETLADLPYEEPGVAPVAPLVAPEPLPPVAAPGVRPRLMPERLAGPTVAIVIDDMGFSEHAVRRLIEARRPLNLAFLPYAENSRAAARIAAAAGLEVMVHLPMEPVGRENPGPGAIRVGMSGDAIKAGVTAAIGDVPGAMGLNNHMGSKATADTATARSVMAAMAGRGMFFLDSRTTGRSQAQAAALAAGVPAIGRDVFLDNDPSTAAVTAQLHVLERLARSRGYAVAIGHPHRTTIDALMDWIPKAEARGIRLTTVSHLVPIDTCRHRRPDSPFICIEPPGEDTLARAVSN
ncbi:divergent polysaccharide deacetylase family protein [Geminicoccus roseus]|uniref:divergent polysaccharide deacetylase family protein n=1 Tax=Geminicoccus roseus TaxID=404900 RepID=UPI00040AB174|nr:divergent polysaccharide deacetylase family protein [Geminicoccus roseus]